IWAATWSALGSLAAGAGGWAASRPAGARGRRAERRRTAERGFRRFGRMVRAPREGKRDRISPAPANTRADLTHGRPGWMIFRSVRRPAMAQKSEIPPSADPAAAPAPRKRRSRFGFFLILFLLVVVGGCALYVWGTLTFTYSDGERAGFIQKFSRKGW